jgi:hypothetical protein
MGIHSGGVSSRAMRAALFFGALWGIAEATLGYLLHLLPFTVPIVSLSGAVMFPIGFFFMYSALRTSSEASSILLTAVVAAAVKAATLLVPGVTFLFVRNPMVAILLEGSLCAAWAGLLPAGGRWLRVLPAAAGLSVSWRAAFLLVSLLAGIRGGILAKGAGSILSFIFLESVINAVLIALLVSASASDRAWNPGVRVRFPRAVVAASSLVVALGVAGVLEAL